MVRTQGRWIAAGLVAIAVVAGAVSGASHGEAADGAEVVQERQALMRGMGANLTTITRYVRGEGGELADVAARADEIAESAARIPELFPEGTGPEHGFETGALPTVWEQPDRFAEVAGVLQAQATSLAEMARAGDEDGVQTTVIGFAQQSCAACHGTFRAPR